ncbi:MAG: multicopper oxidase family protein [Anaerolineae bacterium]|nr:multicopper oxidase family protein [Anaerolineae bacterium]
MRTRIRSLALLGGLFLLLAVASLLFAAPAMADLPPSSCTSDGLGTTTCELWATHGELSMPDSALVHTWGFASSAGISATVPGPLLLGNEGETMVVTLTNSLPFTVALAFPGQDLLPDLDGVPPGGTATYSFTLAYSGTFLYEAGLTAEGPRQVAMGLYGALVVSPTLAPGTYDDEWLLVLGEVDPLLNLDPLNFNLYEYAPRYGLINGQAYPAVPAIDVIPGQTILLRYVNAGLESHWMGLLGLEQQIIASDGQPLPAGYGVVADTIAAGQTVDALATIPIAAVQDQRYALYDTNLLLHRGMMTFLNAVSTATATAGPVASNVLVGPNPTQGDEPVTLSAGFTPAATSAEFFINTVGSPGSGTPMTMGGGGATYSFAAGELPASWPSGFLVFYVRGLDANGWGPVGSAVLNLDYAGPRVTGMSLSPEPSNGTKPVLLRATGDDHSTGRNNVVAATYSITTTARAMLLARIDNPITAMTATLTITDLSTLAEGLHPIAIVAEDALGNLSAPAGVITLTLDQSGPVVSAASLTPALLDLSGAPPVTSVRLEGTISDPLVAEAQSLLANAEAFIDTIGPDGSGFDLFPSDGLFDEITEGVYFDIPVASFLYLAQGDHTVYVHGLDAAGNWGTTFGEAIITIDRGLVDTEGPVIATLTVTFNVAARTATAEIAVAGVPTVEISGAAGDPNLLSNVVGAEWFVDADPGEGMGTPLEAADGVFDTPNEVLVGTVDVSAWPTGEYTFYARALDSLGFWGPTASATVEIDAQAATFTIYLPVISRNP